MVRCVGRKRQPTLPPKGGGGEPGTEGDKRKGDSIDTEPGVSCFIFINAALACDNLFIKICCFEGLGRWLRGKRICCASGKLEFGSHHQHSGSQPSITLALSGL